MASARMKLFDAAGALFLDTATLSSYFIHDVFECGYHSDGPSDVKSKTYSELPANVELFAFGMGDTGSGWFFVPLSIWHVGNVVYWCQANDLVNPIPEGQDIIGPFYIGVCVKYTESLLPSGSQIVFINDDGYVALANNKYPYVFFNKYNFATALNGSFYTAVAQVDTNIPNPSPWDPSEFLFFVRPPTNTTLLEARCHLSGDGPNNTMRFHFAFAGRTNIGTIRVYVFRKSSLQEPTGSGICLYSSASGIVYSSENSPKMLNIKGFASIDPYAQTIQNNFLACTTPCVQTNTYEVEVVRAANQGSSTWCSLYRSGSLLYTIRNTYSYTPSQSDTDAIWSANRPLIFPVIDGAEYD